MGHMLINLFEVLKTASKSWIKKDPFRESAVIAYYTIFALPGLLVMVTALAGYIFGFDAVNTLLNGQIASSFGSETATQINSMILKVRESQNSVWATTIGVATIILGVSGVVAQFQKTLNRIWEVKADVAKAGIWKLVQIRLFGVGLIVSVAFMLMVSLLVSTTLSVLGTWLSNHFSDSFFITLQMFEFVLSIVIFSLLFALMFKYLPDAKIKWRHVWLGSLVTALLFQIGKFGLGLYFGKANPGNIYGAAGSVILILLWVSYSSLIVFYGAEFTHAFAAINYGKVPPSQVAQPEPAETLPD